MWRQSRSRAEPESDQSISDDEELDGDSPENCISLNESTKEQGLQLPLRLEMLKGAHKSASTGKPSEKDTGFGRETEIPGLLSIPGFSGSWREGVQGNLDEEIISDEEENDAVSKHRISTGVEKEDGVKSRGWSAAMEEIDQIRLKSNASCSSSCSSYSKPRQNFKGKNKPKFLFQNRSMDGHSKHERDGSLCINEIFERSENADPKSLEYSFSEFIEDYPEEEEKNVECFPGEDETNRPASVEHSMAELLDGLQDNKCITAEHSKMFSCRVKRGKGASKNSLASLRDRTVDLEDSPEPVDIESSSSDGEVNFDSPKLDIPEMKRPSIAERLQEIVGDTSLNNEEAIFRVANPSGNGLYGKLQQVMQLKKERDLDFVKKQQMGIDSNDELGCIYVKILSKYLDGQMTVCECFIIKNIEEYQGRESSQTMYNELKRKVVIFNPRVCTNVELEVGNLIRIHPPWKEVPVIANDENIILSSYYSQL